MACKTIIFFLLVITKDSVMVKVNLQGQITLGKDVMDTLSYLINSSYASGRRSMLSVQENEMVKLITSKQLCHDLPLCSGPLSSFVDNYLIILTTALENILKTSSVKEYFQRLYYDRLDKILRDVKKILKSVSKKISEETEFYYWSSVLKKISGKFHNFVTFTMAQSFKSMEQSNERRNVIQKVLIAIVVVESKFENKLCTEHRICTKSFKCTLSLHRFFVKLTNLSEKKMRSFIKFFYEGLFATTFYSRLSDITAHEFQVVLNSLAFSKNVSVKDLLQSVHKTVEMRLEVIRNHTDTQLNYDILLIHMILSDLDYIYSTIKHDPFQDFVTNFDDWTSNSHLGKHLRKLKMTDIGFLVQSQSIEISLKITNEVRVFLELTVDPEK